MASMRLPDDPTLAAYAAALNETGHSAIILDAQWRFVFQTDELLISHGMTPDGVAAEVGQSRFGPQVVSRIDTLYFGDAIATYREIFRLLGPYMLFDFGGDREALRREIDAAFVDLIDDMEPVEAPAAWRGIQQLTRHAGAGVQNRVLYLRIRDGAGELVGTAFLVKPRAGMSQLADATAMADPDHLERMALVAQPERRPSAVLMADLEGSSVLARRLSTGQYFAFGRRLVRAADQCIVDHGGITGRHIGDGFVAFFLAETAGSESGAARACIETARVLRSTTVQVAARSGLESDEVALRFGLHWGATIYVGRITTVGRTEVTALGDEVNEAARIEGCATGGRTLASKALIERLDDADARALAIEVDRIGYTPLAELATATAKARRDAPNIAVCDV
jgi:class 3 adenylate cyclase